MPFVGNPRQPIPDGLPFRLTDYLELMGWTGHIIRKDKNGAIQNSIPPVFDRLDIGIENWMTMTQEFEKTFKALVGSSELLMNNVEHLNLERRVGYSACDQFFCVS